MPLSAECFQGLTAAYGREKSYAKVGALLATPGRPRGYSAATVHQLINGAYKAKSLTPIEDAIRATLLRENVDCPALQSIPLAACLDWQAKAAKLSATNPQRVRMYRACRGCDRYRPATGRKGG